MQETTEAPSDEGSADDSSDVSEEEEHECRVCRGPAEEGRPLYSPCKCSGSIGLTHQDCLMSWLAVTRGDGRCELCSTKFRFKPKYAGGAPDRLPPYEVFLGLCSRAVATWLPFTIRVLLVAAVWLGVAPLLNTYLYHGWMHRPASIMKRIKWSLVGGDIVSGLVIASVIIVTFLAFMSFADFLRFNWQNENLGQGGRGRNQRQREPEAVEEENDYGNEYVLDDIVEIAKRKAAGSGGNASERLTSEATPGSPFAQPHAKRRRVRWSDDGNDALTPAELEQRETPDREIQQDGEAPRNGEAANDRAPIAAEQLEADRHDAENLWVREPREQGENIEDDRFEPQFEPLDPVMPMMNPEDDPDAEMNVPIDELLGLRGPLTILLRNLLWLLAFNTSYLGIFVFIPKSFGSSLNFLVFNSTGADGWTQNIPLVYSDNENVTTLASIVSSLNRESERLQTTIQLPDLSLLIIGYIMFGVGVLSMQAGVFVYKLVRTRRRRRSNPGHRRNAHGRDGNAVGGEEQGVAPPPPGIHEGGDENMTLGAYLSVALDCFQALVKVSFLLFIKMLLLPLLLGIWLDVATLQLFGGSGMDRILYAGGDLFSAALLHWVVGITFMLLVTVSVLQLREVVHPDLLAPLIRPQEPQPDLFRNLLHENASTHARRMLLSFIIYAILLTVHVWIPTRILARAGLTRFLPLSDIHLWHVLTPQLQVPLELLLFHLTMLAVLEKCKNQIGAMQHSWLVFMARSLGLTHWLIPLSVDKFVLVGTRPVFLQSSSQAEEPVDPFWYDLMHTQHSDFETIIASNITPVPEAQPPTYVNGQTHANGAIRLGYGKFIRLPQRRGEEPRTRSQIQEIANGMDDAEESKLLLSTAIGAYRLVPCHTGDNHLVIEFWREVPGRAVPRPPEGWDDLGVGGAEVQGRWAWGREKKSPVERGIAKRKPLSGASSHLSVLIWSLKIMMLLALSWVACTGVVFSAISIPLAMGRGMLVLLRVPKHYTHDPFVFAVGSIFFTVCLAVAKKWIAVRRYVFRAITHLAWSLRKAPIRKVGIFLLAVWLWLVVSPVALGVLYELLFIESRDTFSHPWMAKVSSSIFVAWATGCLLLYTWAFLSRADVFTVAFWQELGDDVDHPPRERRDGDGTHRWQGEDGRLNRFVHTMRVIMVAGEWEHVDHEVLLTDCTVPIATEILTTLLAPWVLSKVLIAAMAQLGFSDVGISLPYLGDMDNGVYEMVSFRFLALSCILMQLAKANRDALDKWFNAAHKAARDGRYLEGEVLMNYEAADKPSEL